MENLTFDCPRDGTAAEYPISTAERAGTVPEQTDQPSSDHTDVDLVLAPSDFWTIDFEPRLATLLKDVNKFPGDTYTCEETIVDISIERSRQRGLKKRFTGLEIDWDILNSHVEGIGALFGKRRNITFGIDLIYEEVTGNSMATKSKKGQSATEAQKFQRAADAGLWTRVLLARHLEEIIHHIKGNMKEGENEEEVDVNIEIPSRILGDILNNSQKRKAEDSDCRGCKVHASSHGRHRDAGETSFVEDAGEVDGNRMDRLEEYCDWILQQVKSETWREALQVANQFAMDQFLELNSILKHPKVAADLMVKGGVKPGIALQFVSNINKFRQETKKV
ncbi:hypothetical protein CCUS01_16205 [Colletotrichum cuscutae]|uniref:Uncharacterized protein n=1 Tax=Colletotrichum cuscutae TaxID=1209917 RepID=A0AAI9Y375_9PEZI|nr:hypothetical protein CCUS01_16205 [Colletotrichum cuscutae]